MRLLLITQKIDKHDPLLGFFHRWTEEFAKRCERITVICLQKGEYDLPDNVRVLSLGKEEDASRIEYVRRFFLYILRYRKEYNVVFVHMNAEYVFLGGLLWRIMRKKILLWYNHPKGSIYLRLSRIFPKTIFCTSLYAYSKRYKKTVIMPAGIDTELFVNRGQERKRNSILILGRISPVKKLDVLGRAFTTLSEIDPSLCVSIVGNAPPQDREYEEKIKKELHPLVEKGTVTFFDSVPNYKTPDLYNEHVLYINLTPTGSFDKTILEAMACGCMPLVVNRAYKDVLPPECLVESGDSDVLAEKVAVLLGKPDTFYKEVRGSMRMYVEEKQSLSALSQKIMEYV